MFPSTSLVGFRVGGVLMLLLLLLMLRLRRSVAAMLVRRWACSSETDLLRFHVTAVDASSFSVTFPHTWLIFSMMMMMMMQSNFDISIIPRRGGGRAR